MYMRRNKRKYQNRKYEEKPLQKKIMPRRNRIMGTLFLCIIFVAVVVGNISFRRQFAKTGAQEAEVIRVVDGDTIVLGINGVEERARLIGVDCPESVSEKKEENTVYGEYASDFTKRELTEGKMVYITYDEVRTDQYGRSLVYLWIDKDVGNLECLYQMKLVEEGYAFAAAYEPNTLYAPELYNGMKAAMEMKTGLWGYDDFYKQYKYLLYP